MSLLPRPYDSPSFLGPIRRHGTCHERHPTESMWLASAMWPRWTITTSVQWYDVVCTFPSCKFACLTCCWTVIWPRVARYFMPKGDLSETFHFDRLINTQPMEGNLVFTWSKACFPLTNCCKKWLYLSKAKPDRWSLHAAFSLYNIIYIYIKSVIETCGPSRAHKITEMPFAQVRFHRQAHCENPV